MMAIHYFSGLASASEAEILHEAGVQHVLADPKDWRWVSGFAHRVLDSGAYRAWKSGTELVVDDYLAFAQSQKHIDFWVMPDVIGDEASTVDRWDRLGGLPGMIPVWGFGSDPKLLARYLDESSLVGIGGIAKAMHEKDKGVLKGLQKIVDSHHGRLHAFGLNWPLAMSRLDEGLVSHDSSAWLKAARYGHVVFRNTRTGNLQSAPAKVLGLGHLDRRERLLVSAKAINDFCNGPAEYSEVA
jgi:hypothetical protein